MYLVFFSLHLCVWWTFVLFGPILFANVMRKFSWRYKQHGAAPLFLVSHGVQVMSALLKQN
jgi:hypothetical protein